MILNYIAEKYPDLVPLYHAIYSKNDRTYWRELDAEIREFCKAENLTYVRDDDSVSSPFGEPPVVANYFFHEEVKKSAKKLM
ncbi:MAG: radical SAM protein [Clostridia bacterium]|nr:radical SAM protein [Clostridia bacterium]